MKARGPRWWFATFLVTASFLSVNAQAAQKDLQKLTVGYTPIAGASLARERSEKFSEVGRAAAVFGRRIPFARHTFRAL